jgi:hypothetical protein
MAQDRQESPGSLVRLHKHTFVVGYTNGYIYYTPTARQLENVGGDQEDSDCLLAPAWQPQFEDRVAWMLKKL